MTSLIKYKKALSTPRPKSSFYYDPASANAYHLKSNPKTNMKAKIPYIGDFKAPFERAPYWKPSLAGIPFKLFRTSVEDSDSTARFYFTAPEREIVKFVRKNISPQYKPAADDIYMSGQSVFVLGSTSVGIIPDEIYYDLIERLEKQLEKPENRHLWEKKTKETVEFPQEGRIVVKANDSEAIQLKKLIHNPKLKIDVRLMKRKEGAMAYIDYKDFTMKDSIVEKINSVLGL